MRPLYIFGLDGTLALIDHRRNYVEAPPCSACGVVMESPASKSLLVISDVQTVRRI